MNGINNDVTFRGRLGDKFVQEITVHQQNLTPNTLLQASKGKLIGLDSGKVTDIFESFITGLAKEAKEKRTLKERLNSLNQQVPEKIKEAIKATEDRIFPGVKSALAAKDNEILEKDNLIAQLRKYEGMAKVKSIEDIDTVMPETAIATAQEMRAHQKEARESMLTYLLTGKGQESALAQAERSNIMVKAMKDGITRIPDVAEVIQGLNFAETDYFLKNLMESALKNERGAVIIAPVIRNQVKDNMLGLLLPYADETQSHTNSDAVKRTTDATLDSLVKFHQKLAQLKQKLKSEYPDASKISYNQDNNSFEVYDTNKQLVRSQFVFI